MQGDFRIVCSLIGPGGYKGSFDPGNPENQEALNAQEAAFEVYVGQFEELVADLVERRAPWMDKAPSRWPALLRRSGISATGSFDPGRHATQEGSYPCASISS